MFGFNVNKLKPNLKMAVHRIGIVKNKKANVALAQRREVARLLSDGKEEKARIRVSSEKETARLSVCLCASLTCLLHILLPPGGRNHPR